MAGTRDLGDIFETVDDGLHLHNKLVKTARTTVSITTSVLIYEVQTITISGKVTRIILEMPSLTADAVTVVLSITNSDGTTIYESSACGESDTHILSPDPAIPLVGTNTVILTTNKAPGGSGTAAVTFYFEG